jgi:hypothetical protein
MHEEAKVSGTLYAHKRCCHLHRIGPFRRHGAGWGVYGRGHDASICESLRLRQSLLGAILIGSALIAASVTSGALPISSGTVRGRPAPSTEPRTN